MKRRGVCRHKKKNNKELNYHQRGTQTLKSIQIVDPLYLRESQPEEGRE